MSQDTTICFDVGSLYYLPQYLPVYEELKRRNQHCTFVFYDDPQFDTLTDSIVRREHLPAVRLANRDAGRAWYLTHQPSWIVFGNHHREYLDMPTSIRRALLYHGIGVKSCYYDAELARMGTRFVEGPFLLAELRRRFSGAELIACGFAKLDPLFGAPGTFAPLDLRDVNLDPDLRTVLYAPTYYPSSIELLPDDWPTRLGKLNLIVKPHFFTLSSGRYASQRRKLECWQRAPNVHVTNIEDYSLLPFMATADVLVSEASSALFEFAALDKPVVWCDFFKLRWTYRGPLRFRFERRLDATIAPYREIAKHVQRIADLNEAICHELERPETRREARLYCTRTLIGPYRRQSQCADHRLSAHSPDVAAKLYGDSVSWGKAKPTRKPVLGTRMQQAWQQLQRIITLLKKFDIPYHLEGGTLLGFVRDGGLLPWDTDIDISIPADVIHRLTWRFRLEVRLLGLRFSSRHFVTRGPAWQRGEPRIFKIRRRHWLFLPGHPCLDLIVKYRHDDKVWWAAKDKIMCVDACHYEGYDEMRIHNVHLRIPRHSQSYLTAKYGNWSVPIRDWDCARDEKSIVGNLCSSNVNFYPASVDRANTRAK